ncbi:unnamed protein product [Symbiodinium sp. CCMP2592]|nr:unnamed protein product [Symbiodinium sp. CCMP2592]
MFDFNLEDLASIARGNSELPSRDKEQQAHSKLFGEEEQAFGQVETVEAGAAEDEESGSVEAEAEAAEDEETGSVEAEAEAAEDEETTDHLMPMESSEKRAKVSGKGAWKVWTPEALLRAAFSQASSALRQVASEIDGASAAHVLSARTFVSSVLLKKQEEGLAQELGKARHCAVSESHNPPKLWILNLMFDETELDLSLNGDGPGSWSILASHSQLSFGSAGSMTEQDFIRVPQALPRKTTACMWAALNLGAGGLGPGSFCTLADFPCLLVTCDQASANIKLLKHLHAVLPEQCFFIPMLCAQHRNGNVVERITKLLGILPGSYCVAKCTSKGKVFKDLREAVKQQIDKDLVVMSEEPPGLQAEWSSARKQATTFLELMLQGLGDAKPEERSGVSQRIKKFVDFFRGPWTGPSMTSQELRQHVVVITDHLACDTYGGVEAIKWARNSYNDRHPAHVILDLTNEFGSKLWLGGSKAGTDTNLMIRNGIGAVWPAAKSVQPDDTAAIRVLRYTDGTGVVHGNVNMESVLQQIDNVISLLHRGVSVLICCVNGAHRSATLGAMTLMNYVSTLRNIVDLNSRAPPSQYRVNTIRPIDFLIEHQAEIAGKSGASGLVQVGSNQEIFPSTRYANALITPVQFRRRCIEMGFVLSGKGKRTRQSLPGPQSLISSMPPPPPPGRSSSTHLRSKARPVKPRSKGVSPGQVRQSGTDTDSSYINVPTDGFITDDSEMPHPKRISEDSSASGQVSAASADDEAVDPPVMVEIEVADDEENEESTMEKACEKGAAEAEEPESDFEMVTCDDEGKVADVNPESPPQTPRANWTSEDFARLETVMRDLGHLNRQLLSFNNAEVEEDQAQADDQASASGPVSDQIAEPGQQAAEADEPGGTSADPVESDEGARDEASGQVDDEPATPATAESGEPLEPSSLDLEKTMEALKAQAAEGDKDEMLGRLFGLLETQKVQQQALLSRLQSRQEMDERKNVILTALYNRDMTRLRAELQALTVSDLVSIRDEEGMTVAHHAVRLGLGPCLEYTLRKAPTLADAVTNPSGRPANWTPLMVLVDAPPGSLGGTDYAYDMLKVLVSYMSVTGLVNLGPFKSPTGATAFHIAASRGNHRGLQKLLWSLYHKSGGDRNSTYAFGLVTSLVNSPGLKRGQGVVDAALANNVDLAMYVKRNWGGVELLSPPSRGGYAA